MHDTDVERRLAETLSTVAGTARATDRWADVASRRRWPAFVRVAGGFAVAAAAIVVVGIWFTGTQPEAPELAAPGGPVPTVPADPVAGELPRLILDLPGAVLDAAFVDEIPFASEYAVDAGVHRFYGGGGQAAMLPVLELASYADAATAAMARGDLPPDGLRFEGQWVAWSMVTDTGGWVEARAVGVNTGELMTIVSAVGPAFDGQADEVIAQLGMQPVAGPAVPVGGPTSVAGVRYLLEGGGRAELALTQSPFPGEHVVARLIEWAEQTGGAVDVADVAGIPALVFDHLERGRVAVWEPAPGVVAQLVVSREPARIEEVLAAVVEVDQAGWEQLTADVPAAAETAPAVLDPSTVDALVGDFEADLGGTLGELVDRNLEWTTESLMTELARAGMCQLAGNWLAGDVATQERAAIAAAQIVARSDVQALAANSDTVVVLDRLASAIERGDRVALAAEFGTELTGYGPPMCGGR